MLPSISEERLIIPRVEVHHGEGKPELKTGIDNGHLNELQRYGLLEVNRTKRVRGREATTTGWNIQLFIEKFKEFFTTLKFGSLSKFSRELAQKLANNKDINGIPLRSFELTLIQGDDTIIAVYVDGAPLEVKPDDLNYFEELEAHGLLNIKQISNDRLKISLTQDLFDAVSNGFSAEKEIIADDISMNFPAEISNSIKLFYKDYPDKHNVAFIMMQFLDTTSHAEIVDAIRDTLDRYGLIALRADDKEYHHDLFPNVETYLHSCGFGIAVFENIEDETFNPNVALEVGYMLAMGKNVCLLKDKSLKSLQTDLIGKLYREFDAENISASIEEALTSWLRDKNYI